MQKHFNYNSVYIYVCIYIYIYICMYIYIYIYIYVYIYIYIYIYIYTRAVVIIYNLLQNSENAFCPHGGYVIPRINISKSPSSLPG